MIEDSLDDLNILIICITISICISISSVSVALGLCSIEYTMVQQTTFQMYDGIISVSDAR